MSDEARIYVDATRPAMVLHAGGVIDCATLQEATLAWYRLPADQRPGATIQEAGAGGAVYGPSEIERLEFGARDDEGLPPEKLNASNDD